MLDDYDDQAVDIVALFTDGVNDDPAGGLSLDRLRSRLERAADPDRPVTVLLIGMGGVDAASLRPVAQAVPTEGGGGGARVHHRGAAGHRRRLRDHAPPPPAGGVGAPEVLSPGRRGGHR